MKINNKKELKRIAEEKSGHSDYKDLFYVYDLYNYCTYRRTIFFYGNRC